MGPRFVKSVKASLLFVLLVGEYFGVQCGEPRGDSSIYLQQQQQQQQKYSSGAALSFLQHAMDGKSKSDAAAAAAAATTRKFVSDLVFSSAMASLREQIPTAGQVRSLSSSSRVAIVRSHFNNTEAGIFAEKVEDKSYFLENFNVGQSEKLKDAAAVDAGSAQGLSGSRSRRRKALRRLEGKIALQSAEEHARIASQSSSSASASGPQKKRRRLNVCSLRLPSNARSFDQYLPLWEFWKAYFYSSVLRLSTAAAAPVAGSDTGSRPVPASSTASSLSWSDFTSNWTHISSLVEARISKCDLHGCLLTVVRSSRHPELVGISGIVLTETENTFGLMTTKSVWMPALPKAGQLLQIRIGNPSHGSVSASSLSTDTAADSHLTIHLMGSALLLKPADRTTRKRKTNVPLDF